MTDVKHMKWWGWGVEGVSFHWQDKPGFAPFVLRELHLDLQTSEIVEKPDFASIAVADPVADPTLTAALASIMGDDDVTTDAMDRVVHTYGKGLRDLVRIRQNRIGRVPDLVVYPDDESEVQRVVDAVVAADAVLIPFGGGSNIAGSLEPRVDERRAVVSLDLGRLRQLIHLDEESGLARIQAGVLGPDLEAQLAERGWTLGHFPDSFTHSTLGGWIATRSSGMQSDKYGDIADIVRGLRLVRPGGVVAIRPVPSTSTGPSLREMILGSEGRLGVITEATVQVHRKPAQRVIHAYFFPSWQKGVAAMRAIAESDATPIVTRVSDARETTFSMATSKERHGLDKFLAGTALPAMMRAKGWDLDEICLSFIGYEGASAHVKRQKKLVERIVRKHGGMGVGTGPGVLYDQKKFDTPYIRDFLLDRGAVGDVSETAAPWSALLPLYNAVVAAANGAFDRLNKKGYVMCHLSHSYHSGACLYFTFAFVGGDDVLAEYDVVKSAIQQAFVDNGGTLSHHHGVGVEHGPWLEQDISAEGARVLRELFRATDPGDNLNPGKIALEVQDRVTG
ncbi:FAD-binding oxidoreductase [Micromonospora zamorensis]|uniref:FAD-binding oxidoreductase n=1 Tax=Micromonospora zamorensis TaxID=709883 RepID=UPI003D96DA53